MLRLQGPVGRLTQGILATGLLITLAACGKGPQLGTGVAAQALRARNAVNWAELLARGPRISHTGDGDPGDPVNVAVVGTEGQVLAAFEKAEWDGADAITAWAVLKIIGAGITRRGYDRSPISPLALFDRSHDFAYQKHQRSVYARDHLRGWRAPWPAPDGRPLWLISATKDTGVKWVNGHVTHRIHPDLDSERQLVVQDLQKTGWVGQQEMVPLHPAGFSGQNGERDPYFSRDGLCALMVLGDRPATEPPPPGLKGKPMVHPDKPWVMPTPPSILPGPGPSEAPVAGPVPAPPTAPGTSPTSSPDLGFARP